MNSKCNLVNISITYPSSTVLCSLSTNLNSRLQITTGILAANSAWPAPYTHTYYSSLITASQACQTHHICLVPTLTRDAVRKDVLAKRRWRRKVCVLVCYIVSPSTTITIIHQKKQEERLAGQDTGLIAALWQTETNTTVTTAVCLKIVSKQNLSNKILFDRKGSI